MKWSLRSLRISSPSAGVGRMPFCSTSLSLSNKLNLNFWHYPRFYFFKSIEPFSDFHRLILHLVTKGLNIPIDEAKVLKGKLHAIFEEFNEGSAIPLYCQVHELRHVKTDVVMMHVIQSVDERVQNSFVWQFFVNVVDQILSVSRMRFVNESSNRLMVCGKVWDLIEFLARWWMND